MVAFKVVCFLMACVLRESYGLTLQSAECDGPGLRPHPTDCRAFVICVEIKSLLYQAEGSFMCPKNFAFSKHDNLCLPDAEVPECPSMAPSSRRSARQISAACSSVGVTCSSCSDMVICVGSETSGYSALLDINCATLSAGAPYCNSALGSCSSTPSNANCGAITGNLGACSKVGSSIPDPTSTTCTSFYTCELDNGVLRFVRKTCLEFMAFHSILGYCVNAYYVICTVSTTPAPSTTLAAPVTSTSLTPATTTPATTITPTTTPTTITPTTTPTTTTPTTTTPTTTTPTTTTPLTTTTDDCSL